MKTLTEFSIDFDEADGLYYLVHQACDSLEMAVNVELPASSCNLVDCIEMATKHMKERHGVDLGAFDPADCTRADTHFMVRKCSECGFSSD